MTTSTLRFRLGRLLVAGCLLLAGSLPLAAADNPTPAQQQAASARAVA